ncbi:DUF5655 domain-containing protein [Euzebya sp.]|uniref:DUF5655 domain-containing protein n=1 Tax=Euzebya sp. TaxID=1971409 RepID=UPI003512E46E
MATWTCPDCGRRFGRRNAGHVCAPAMTLEEWLATSPPHERPVAERLIEAVAELPDAWVEPVQVGLFVKRSSTFCALRTMTRWTALSLKLPRVVTAPEPDRKVQSQGIVHHHTWNLRRPEDLTDELIGLLGESYDFDAPRR